MEVSSIEDKSQGDTHIEKKAYGRHPGVKTYVYKASSDPFSNYKAFKSRKTVSTRIVAYDACSWSMTTPSSTKKRKIITRRKSWPPDAPQKLNVRKKYQNLKLKDALEPFWSNTYEWAAMQRGPESIRPAPLAKLLEFTGFEKYKVQVKPYKSDVQGFTYTSAGNYESVKRKNSDLIAFYFIKKEPLKAYNQKNYLTNLKKMCLADNKTCVVRELNQTNFASPENSTEDSSSKNTKNNSSINAPILATNHNVTADSKNDHLLNQMPYAQISHDSVFNDRVYVSYPNNDSYGRPVRQLNSLNSDLSSNVAVERPVAYLDDDVTYIKNKLIFKDVAWNKENIKFDNFSNSKITHIGEKCKPLTLSDTTLKNQKIQKSFKPQNKNVKLTTIDWPDYFDKSEIKLNKPIKNKIKGSPHGFENKAPQDMDTGSKGTNKESKSAKDSPSQSSSSSMSVSEQTSMPSSSQAPSNQSSANRPYLRQLFEHDIQSNFESLKKNKEPNKDDEKPSSEKNPNEKSATQTSSASTIPANVLGFDFLTTLQKRVDIGEASNEAFPASAIGQAFLDNLADQKEKFHGSSSESKSIPSSVVGLSFLKSLVENATSSKSDDQPLPASVIGQSFLKNLLESQSSLKCEDSKLEMPQQMPKSEISHSEQAIPSSVIGQAFLKTLVDTQQHVEKRESPKPIPSEVLGQTFLKSLIDESKDTSKTVPTEKTVSPENSSVPATVIGQSFLKNLLEQSTVVQNPEFHYAHPVSVIDETDSKSIGISQEPSSALVKESDLGSISTEKNVIPAPVIGQSFLKNLLESESPSKPTDDSTKEVPAPVIGQAFLKSLIEYQSSQPPETAEKSKTVPATVIGQSFLKNLIETESCIKSSDQGTKEIPAPVIGQAFLKSLVENQSLLQTDIEEKSTDACKTVPAAVVSQSFLKSLIQEQPVQENQKDLPIPASVIGQAFLKTLGASQDPVAQSPSIPAPVIGQAFLKSLLEQPNSGESKEKTIPAPVLGQSFLKTLIQKEEEISKVSPVDESRKGETESAKPIPSSVVGQTFLKSLISERSVASEKTETIPSQVVGQAFLKTLLDTAPASEAAVDKPIPANVLGQVFMKCLVDEGGETSDISSPDQTVSSKEQKKETVIPSQVLGQAFLKTLTSEEENVSKSKELQSNPQQLEASIPASVIGLAFLKTLTSQPEDKPPATQKSIPAGVVGQAFLRTLVDLNDDSTTAGTDSSLETFHKNESAGNGFHAENIDSDSGIDIQSPIIPPPPEFGSPEGTILSNVPGTSANVDVTPGIIDELLSYTKMMHSVIESMKESDESAGTSENQNKKKD